ncbi:hypothetical protein [Streptomyces sp. NPDC005423]|uniref:hypothetical protein n=1 Tax=Streptomyces sp. NPDC005423 TaxID=3155343 RepID=UPI0033A59B5A
MAQPLDIFDIFAFEPTDDEKDRIAGLATGTTLFFDHRDPAMVAWLDKRHLDS